MLVVNPDKLIGTIAQVLYNIYFPALELLNINSQIGVLILKNIGINKKIMQFVSFSDDFNW